RDGLHDPRHQWRRLARRRRRPRARRPQWRLGDPAGPAAVQRQRDLRGPHDQHPAGPPAQLPPGKAQVKITDIELRMLRVPLKTPFKTALRTVDTVEDIVVLVRTDTGHTGHGEAPATAVITGDTHGSIAEAIERFIKPRLIGQEIANLNRICGLVQGALERNT